MLDEKAREQFRKWGAMGGKARARKWTKAQLSALAIASWQRIKRKRARAKS